MRNKIRSAVLFVFVGAVAALGAAENLPEAVSAEALAAAREAEVESLGVVQVQAKVWGKAG